jgi:hypothetical protein
VTALEVQEPALDPDGGDQHTAHRTHPATIAGAGRTVSGMEESRVLATFVKEGRIVTMPTRRTKRLVVLDHVAQSFEPGRTYPEPEVNEVLRTYHEDVAALRRYLVDEGFLTREAGTYWRTGGTVPV